MRKVLLSLASLMGLAFLASPCQAGFTLFDTARDSMYVARGEFVALERTAGGDRLVFRCDTALKGSISGEVTLEPFEKAPADAALGRPAIVGFNLINGKYHFSYHQRRGVFMHEDGIDKCETALRRLIEINAPFQPLIENELRKRLEYQNLAHEGEYPAELLSAWRQELVDQCSLSGSAAARDAAKCLFEHPLFKGTATLGDLHKVAQAVVTSARSTHERAYMLLLIRDEVSVHPSYETLLGMLWEEAADYNVAHLASLLSSKPRAQVIQDMAAAINDAGRTSQQRENAVHVLGALRDEAGLPTIRGAVNAERLKGAVNFDRKVMRRALLALRDIPSAENAQTLEQLLDSDICREKFEFLKRTLVAWSTMDTEASNNYLRGLYKLTQNNALKQFVKGLLPENKEWRRAVIVHPEE